MNTVIFIVVVVVLIILALFVIPQWRMRSAMRLVIQIFREHNAVSIKNAKTVEELELVPRSMMQGLFKGRDYKPYALNVLMKAEVIQSAEDDRLYLSEDKLFASRIEKGPYSR